jgi:hypothetical protein
MNKNIISLLLGLSLVGCSSDDDRSYMAQQVAIEPIRPPLYPDTSKVATVLSKKSLKHNREQYHVRLTDGREIDFIIDSHLPFQVGDVIVLPS